MLKLTDEGANITLVGQPSSGDGLFWFGFALLFGAVAVAIAMSVLPVQWAIGALGLLVITSFVFNWQRNQQKKKSDSQLSSGVVKVCQGKLVYSRMGRSQEITLQADDNIQTTQTQLQILSADGQLRLNITGFESSQEIAVMAAILQGKAMNKRHAKIRMQSNCDD